MSGREDVKEDVTGLFNTVIEEIDYVVAGLLDLEGLVKPVREMVEELAKRRLSRAAEARPALKGAEETLIKSKGKTHKKRRENDSPVTVKRLTDFV